MSNTEQLPKSWKWVKLSEIAKVFAGSAAPQSKEDFATAGPLFVRVSDLSVYKRTTHLNTARDRLSDAALERGGHVLAHRGAILFPKSGAAIGTNNRAILAQDAYIVSHLMAVEPTVGVLSQWLYLLFCQMDMMSLSDNSSYPSLKQSAIERVRVPLPPLKEQEYLTKQIGEALAQIGLAQAALQAQQEAVAALPAAYLRSVFESAQAARWPQKRLGSVLKLRNEIVHPRDNPQGSGIFVGLEHIEPTTGRRLGSIPVEMSTLSGRKPKFYAGDIVYGYLRPYLNKLWLAEHDGLCSVDQYVYEVDKEKVAPDFIAWFMRSSAYLRRAPIGTIQSQLPRIRTEEVASVPLGLPDMATQQKIARHLSAKMEEVQVLRASLDEQRRQLDALSAALLRQAMSGQWSRQAKHQWKERRAAIITYTVNTYSDLPTYGHVVQQKVVVLAQRHVGIELNQDIQRLRLGPADFPALLEAEGYAQEKGWFRTIKTDQRYSFEPMENVKEGVQLAIELMGERKAEMDRLLRYLMGQPTDFVERVATLYEAWRTLLVLGQTPTEDEIVEEVLNWHDSKRRFPPFKWKATLNDMKRYNFVPRIETEGEEDE